MHAEDGPSYHGNYRACRSTKRVKKYCTKDGTFITNLNRVTLLKVSPYQEARETARGGDLSGAMKILETYPGPSRDLFLNHERMSSYLKSLSQAKPRVAPTVRGLDSFGPTPQWDRKSSLIVYGPAGAGKTELAKALIPSALFCRRVERLRDFNPAEHGGIIFDDMSFLHWDRTDQIHLVDFDNDSDIHGRYKDIFIPAGTLKIFSTNISPWNVFRFDPAIVRRVTVWEMKDFQTIKLYVY